MLEKFFLLSSLYFMDCYSRHVCLIYNDIVCGIFRMITRRLWAFLAKCQIGECGFVSIALLMVRWSLRKVPLGR